MSRYDLPDPKCRHKPKVIVRSGDLDGQHASTYCCDRNECVGDAIAWAKASTGGLPIAIRELGKANAS